MRSADCRPRAHSIHTLDPLPVSHHSFREHRHGRHDPATDSIFSKVESRPKSLEHCQLINKFTILIHVWFNLNVYITYCLLRRRSGSPARIVSLFPCCLARSPTICALTSDHQGPASNAEDTHTHLHKFTHVHKHTPAHVYRHVCARTCMHTPTHYTCAHTHARHTRTHKHCTSIHIHMHTFTHTQGFCHS